jgi:hypothetical protein
MAQHHERASLVLCPQSLIHTLPWPRHTLVTMTTRHSMQRRLRQRMRRQQCPPLVMMQLHMQATPPPMIPPDTIDIETFEPHSRMRNGLCDVYFSWFNDSRILKILIFKKSCNILLQVITVNLCKPLSLGHIFIVLFSKKYQQHFTYFYSFCHNNFIIIV